MKYLVLIVVLVVAYMFWRNARLERQRDAHKPPPAPAIAPQEMVRCAACGLHLPRTDAVAGSDGALYCGNEHRLRAGG
jgi:uncharacterized protein